MFQKVVILVQSLKASRSDKDSKTWQIFSVCPSSVSAAKKNGSLALFSLIDSFSLNSFIEIIFKYHKIHLFLPLIDSFIYFL